MLLGRAIPPALGKPLESGVPKYGSQKADCNWAALATDRACKRADGPPTRLSTLRLKPRTNTAGVGGPQPLASAVAWFAQRCRHVHGRDPALADALDAAQALDDLASLELDVAAPAISVVESAAVASIRRAQLGIALFGSSTYCDKGPGPSDAEFGGVAGFRGDPAALTSPGAFSQLLTQRTAKAHAAGRVASKRPRSADASPIQPPAKKTKPRAPPRPLPVHADDDDDVVVLD